MLEGENPASRIAMLHEDNKVERYMDEAELRRLLAVLRRFLAVLRPGHRAGSTVCSVALFLLSTGCRLNEALSATWDDVNVEQRVFTIRATNSKSRKLRSVPLNDSAIEVLNGLKTKEQGGPLFRGRRGEPLKYVAKV